MPTLPNGFPNIYAEHPVFFFNNLARDQLSRWGANDVLRVAITSWEASANDPEIQQRWLVVVPKVVAKHHNNATIQLGIPCVAVETSRLNQPPFAFIGFGMTEELKCAMVAQFCYSTPKITFFVHKISWDFPTFLATFEGFSNLSHEQIVELIQRHFADNATLNTLIHLVGADNDGRVRIQRTLNSLTIKFLDIKVRGGLPSLAVNVYADSPSDELQTWELWCTYVTQLTFPTAFHGTGKARPNFHCTGCHGCDHPRGLCPFASLPGWNGHTKTNGPDVNDDDHPGPAQPGRAGPSCCRTQNRR
ncbi:hypothetical protein SCP_0804550 [Sparassis crispa]|uniref:Uncharacterized protein n=1 Tax=Sparassis crispa TaxID=139825 RepID=A0A401GUM3_9APHY|nr:hypothetical protein SCP_0804550 [Sparassis crispa]GBE85931.1 hypothetical protein SCP_0804550 [Sparassis crispa]